MSDKNPKIAVILFNLGGPDQPQSVEPFLYNLFNDPAIISAPWPIRPLLAKFISKRRGPIAREIYENLGGGSPIVPETQKQLDSLDAELKSLGYENCKTFMAMRYWHPFLDETLKKVKSFNPEKIILLPLYPQFSTATTGSSFKEFYKIYKDHGLEKVEVNAVCCYGEQNTFIESHVNKLTPIYEKAREKGSLRVLFSAHGLPQKIVDKGDPYEQQIRNCVQHIADRFSQNISNEKFDHTVCFQSRVGPLKWIGPSLDEEMERAAADQLNVVVVPIAFVSEHSETLVELDIEYKEVADKLGIKHYFRVPTLSDDRGYSRSLAELVIKSHKSNKACMTMNKSSCGNSFSPCPLN